MAISVYKSRNYFSATALGVGLLVVGLAGTAQSQPAIEAARLGAAAPRGVKPVMPPPIAAVPSAKKAAVSAATVDAPKADEPESSASCPGGLPEPIRVRLSAGKSTMINLPESATRRTVGDPMVVYSRLITPEVLYLVSGRIGQTNVIIQGNSGRCVVLDVAVAVDTEVVQSKLAELMPNEKSIRVTSAGDSLILSGVVADILAVERAVLIANAYVRTPNPQGSVPSAPSGGSSLFASASAPTQLALARAEYGAAPQLARVVNMLSVNAAQQVMLEVKVAEVSKTLLDKLGSSFGASRTSGSWTYSILTDLLTNNTTGGIVGAAKDAANRFSIDAKKQDGLVRILAEPNVMAISGQEGTFLAGGKILIPVAQNNSGNGIFITLEEKEFGVGLKFTPTVLSDGRINLKVAPEVSELSREGIGISTVSFTGTNILPLITTRRASTTVQLLDGQSFAIGGLIKNSVTTNIAALPVLGELPVLGPLFRSNEFQSEKTELVFIVTPRIVRPLPPDYQLPTDRVGEASRQGFFMNGRMDSQPPAAPGSSTSAPKSGGFEIK